MTNYRNLSRESGVDSYEIGEDFIIVKFKHGTPGKTFYKYSYSKPGTDKVEKMKQLAAAGRGLNSYISTKVKKDYEKCW